MRSQLRFILALGLVCGAAAQNATATDEAAENVTKIPVDAIVGPNFRHVRKLEEPAKFDTAAEQSIVVLIENAVRKLGGDGPPPGFAVRGSGRSALKGISQVLIAGAKPSERFSRDSDVSIVFVKRTAGPHLRIIDAERTGDRIVVRYVLVTNAASYGSAGLAIIPLGRLLAGTYRVTYVRAYDEESKFNRPEFPAVQKGIEQQIISEPFEFTITN